MSEQTTKEAREAAKAEAKRKEQQGVFSAWQEAGKEAKEPGKDGVIAPISRDAQTGRWLPGNPGGPGRGTKRRENAIADALSAAIQPETVADVVYGLITHPNSWRANAAGLEWYGKYMLGPAPARTPEKENVIDVILARMRDSVDTKKE